MPKYGAAARSNEKKGGTPNADVTGYIWVKIKQNIRKLFTNVSIEISDKSYNICYPNSTKGCPTASTVKK
jgi:hypothetical protein